MKLKFVTSVSREYWYGVGKHCIDSWDLPGELVIYIDQEEGEVEWFNDINYKKLLLHVPPLQLGEEFDVNTKVRKFWGKSCAQIHAIKNRDAKTDERIIWLDADVEQIKPVDESLFNFKFEEAVAMMKSNNHSADCYETGLVIFNNDYIKLTVWANKYAAYWNNITAIKSLHRPYDAIVLGNFARGEKIGMYNLCNSVCNNVDALKHTRFDPYFKHWINKANKEKLVDQILSK